MAGDGAMGSEATYQALFEATPDAMLVVDQEGVIALVNAQAERLSGYRRDELIGRPVEVLVPDGLRELHSVHRASYTKDPSFRPMGSGALLRLRHRDGSEIPADISLSFVATDQGPLVSAAVRDVSARVAEEVERDRLREQAQSHQLELVVAEAQRLESLGRLAGGVAHDFNNLLAVILNHADFVAQALPPDSDDWSQARSDIDQILRAAQRASDLTRQLLAVGRRRVVRARAVDLNDLVVDVAPLLRRAVGEHVELVTTLAAGLPSVSIDPGQMEHVLINLAINARDAMPDGGTLLVETRWRAAGDGGRTVELRLTDTGTGMAPDVLERAFEPFFTTKGDAGGSGLGLAMVHGIVSQSGGVAGLESVPGSGTTFSAAFPATDEVAVGPEPVRPVPPAAGTGQTVLVVEDERAIRAVVTRMLSRNGYRVVAVAGLGEALAVVCEPGELVDLVLTDVVMPGGSGPQLVERARTGRPGLPVLYMTGHAPATMVAHRLDTDAHLLEKPFTEAELLAAVEAILAGPR